MGAAWSWLTCSPEHRPVKYGDAQPAVPADDKAGRGAFHRSFDDRLWLFSRTWEPADKSKTWATLMIVHGTVDHSGVYAEIAEHLANLGVVVFAADMRGWGRSDGQELYFHSVDVFVKDVVEDYNRLHGPGGPYEHVGTRFLCGKSIGGLITAWAASGHPSLWSGLLGLSGAYDIAPSVQPSPVALAILKFIGFFLPKMPFRAPFDPKLIVSDEGALEKWRNDPLVSRGKLTIAYMLELLRCCRALPSRLGSLQQTPMLMMWGTGDKVVTEAGHKMMVDHSQHSKTCFKTYPNGFHNLLAEPSLKAQVIADFTAWLQDVAGGSQAATKV